MRTLKKTLSLVLVVAMVLGLCVVGASAYNKVEDFTDDVDKIGDAYYEAVGVLTGIGIIDGMTETAFEPQGNYTREQAAKIIAYMQLGKAKADSLKCTVAPFEDVAASRWSAGYIAYCVEQGIIDGMTETTFEPTAKLTGFQWAKMLLCAVGFGVNGEFTGSSWSVNTAKVAHTVDLFAGDLAGADHTALTREQAALYAFNVLTNVKKVAYSPNVTSYVYGIQGYTTVNGIGSTLGEDVFGLESDTGIITANEGTGAKYTTLSTNYTNGKVVANIDADTGIDMFYHAARIWSVKGVSVFVYDLAKVTEYNCAVKAGEAAAKKAGAATKTLGDKNATAYELDLIDNTAYAKNSYGAVTFNYSTAELGTTTSSGVTYLYDPNYYQANAGIKSANIWTDISKINKGTTVVYLVEGGQYYIYSTSATTGTIDSYSNKTGVITLTDGTKLEPSVFNQYKFSTAAAGKTFTFLLDSHGHYMGLTKAGVANLYFFTGEFKPTNDYNGWIGERVWDAQFINVTTGEVVELNVGNSWLAKALTAENFYDIGYADANGVYAPEKITAEDNIYAGTYVIEANALYNSATADERVIDAKVDDKPIKVKVTFDNPTKYIIANGTGSSVKVEIYDSFADMIAAYPGNSVTFSTTALTVYGTSTKNVAGSVVFGYLGTWAAKGSNLFLPANISADDWTYSYSTKCYSYDGFYLNGQPVTVYVSKAGDIKTDRGFYDYTVTNGMWTLDTITKDVYVGLGTLTTAANVVKLDGHSFVSAPVIVDLRAGVKDEDKIDTVDELVAEFRNETFMVAYTLSGNAIDVAYILDAGWQTKLTFALTDALVDAGWRIVDKNGKEYTSITYLDADALEIDNMSNTLTLRNKNLEGMSYGGSYAAEVVYNKTTQKITTSALKNGELTVTFMVDPILQSTRDQVYTIGGLLLGTVNATYQGYNVVASNNTNVVLGEAIDLTITNTDATVTFKNSNGETVPGGYIWNGTATVNEHHTADLVGKLSSDSRVITTSFYPLVPNSVTYTVVGTAWIIPNA